MEIKNENITYIHIKYGVIRCEHQLGPNILYLSNLVVDQHHRMFKLGTELMNKAIHKAKELQCDSVSLEVHSYQDWLIKWYEKLGFRIVGYGYSEQYYLMNKRL